MATVKGDGNPGVLGTSQQDTGVLGQSASGYGVHGQSTTGWGVVGDGPSSGVVGQSLAPAIPGQASVGVAGISRTSTGVQGLSRPEGAETGGYGVHGYSPKWHGVVGETRGAAAGVVGHNLATGGEARPGVAGVCDSANTSSPGVEGYCTQTGSGATGVYGHADGYGVMGISRRVGVYGEGVTAGQFVGNVAVTGTITGNKAFKIDHPLDPANTYLNHASVESPERKNVYDGVAQLDEGGEAWVDLPEWFEALNGDFRYQLTAVGGAAPNVHVAEEISEKRFKIAGGEGGMKVCWQVTGSRKDPWAAANPFVVEQDKPQDERGRYLHPDLYGAPEEQSVLRAPLGEESFETPPSFEPPQAPEIQPGFDLVDLQVDFVGLQEEHRQQMDELRGQIEELRRGSLEEEIDELRRQIKKLRRGRKR